MAPILPVISKYARAIPPSRTHLDVYDILVMWGVTCPATAHAIKKLLMAGQRGDKNTQQDLAEAIVCVGRALKLNEDG